MAKYEVERFVVILLQSSISNLESICMYMLSKCTHSNERVPEVHNSGEKCLLLTFP